MLNIDIKVIKLSILINKIPTMNIKFVYNLCCGLKRHNLRSSQSKNYPEKCITSAYKDQIGSEQNFIRILSELMWSCHLEFRFQTDQLIIFIKKSRENFKNGI